AIGGLADHPLIAGKPVWYGTTDVSPIQRLWLKARIPCLGAGTAAPSINVSVRWNRVFVARVHSGLHVGPMAAEGRDSLYVWCLGAWIRMHDYNHEMA
ncbi:MAG: hypothetical protein GY851_16085, partial [bacterium]|nr:hypothetical protein [bacterium]